MLSIQMAREGKEIAMQTNVWNMNFDPFVNLTGTQLLPFHVEIMAPFQRPGLNRFHRGHGNLNQHSEDKGGDTVLPGHSKKDHQT